jgi:acyl carrier protein
MGQDITDRVRQIVAEQLGIGEGEVRVSSSFTDLGADSFAVVEMVLALEEAFEVEIADTETDRLRTVGDAIGFVVTARQRQGR